MINNPVITNSAIGNPTNDTVIGFFQRAVPSIITVAFVIGLIVFMFNLIVGAIQWMSSGGDKQGVEAAKGKVSSALIGLVILFALFAILTTLGKFFDIKILTLDIGSLIIK